MKSNYKNAIEQYCQSIGKSKQIISFYTGVIEDYLELYKYKVEEFDLEFRKQYAEKVYLSGHPSGKYVLYIINVFHANILPFINKEENCSEKAKSR